MNIGKQRSNESQSCQVVAAGGRSPICAEGFLNKYERPDVKAPLGLQKTRHLARIFGIDRQGQCCNDQTSAYEKSDHK